ncbi:MAG: M14 family metallopeptidase [Bacteroidota bacterium]|nr:M14 family metallopeptidase [Bacteroidota bacterium]
MSKIFNILIFIFTTSFAQDISVQWLTKAERTNYQETSRYEETLGFCKQLEKASHWVKLTSIGKSGEGRDIPLMIVSKDKIFNPAKAYRSSKTVILIQNGIHSGEIDGKDACLMLVRDLVILKKSQHLLDNTILLILPIYNVDGHERFGPYNRINQNGPKEMGWRTNATNLNLNRDYMKADAPETRAFLKMFTTWLPDFFIDTHITNGADYQYSITYSIDHYDNVSPSVRTWIEEKFLKSILPKMEEKGYPLVPYVWLHDNKDLSKGMSGGVAPPRLSNAYTPLQNRPGLLVEMHMLKDYRTRVTALYQFLFAILEFFETDATSLKRAVRIADEKTINVLENPFPIRFENTQKTDTILFLGYKAVIESSEVSGSDWIRWTDEPNNVKMPFFNDVKVKQSIDVPYAYLIPPQWKNVIEVLQMHGIGIEKLKQPVEVDVELYRFKDAKWQEKPYEGRHPVTYKAEKFSEKKKYSAGTVLVRLNQRTAKVAIHLLEPEASDALAAWGFFDAVFEQKEYVEAYVAEKLSREMMAKDPNLKKEFEERIKTDSTFAKSPNARLNFFYQRSPYWDNQLNLYPVARVMSEQKFVAEPIK